MFKKLSLGVRITIAAGVPFLVALFFMAGSITDSYRIYREMEQAETFSQLATRISALVHETQKERGASGVFMGSRGVKFGPELDQQRQTTDQRITELSAFLADFDAGVDYGELTATLAEATSLLAALPDYRDQASSLNVPAGKVLGLYTQHNAKMLDVISVITKSNTDADMVQASTAYVNFLLGKERAGIERAIMSKTFAEDRFASGTLRKFGTLVTAQATYFDGFVRQAAPAQVAFFEERMGDPVTAEVQRMRDIAFATGEVRTGGFGIDSKAWYTASTGRINLMKKVDDYLANDIRGSISVDDAALGSLLEFTTAVSALVHETQKERGLTAGYVGSERKSFGSELASQRRSTTARYSELQQYVVDLPKETTTPKYQAVLNRAVTNLGQLQEHRKQVDGGSISTVAAIGWYTNQNSLLLDVVAETATVTNRADISTSLIAYANFLQGKERAGVERAVLNKTFATDRFADGALQKFGALVAAQNTYFDVFSVLSTPKQVAFFTQTMTGPHVNNVNNHRDTAFQVGVVNTNGFGVDPAHWFTTITAKINLMKEVENRLVADMGELADQKRTSARTTLLTAGGATLVSMVIVSLLVLAVSKSITRPFQRIFRGLKSFSAAELEDTSITFNRIIGGITDSMQQVSDASAQVAGASQSLAESTSEQAASLEETAASLEEMAAMTRTNSENSSRADELSTHNHTSAQQGNESMVKLSEASSEISSIIKTIEEIAFQTELLALNAAVEAARAGDHGKGFAVVAEEVRSLAKRASAAAGETGSLIDNSVKLSQDGAKAVQEIVTGVAEVSDLVDGISQASEQQAQGVGEVNTAVGQMDTVIQKNAATAEESAAAAEELSAQAAATQRLLDELIGLVKGNTGQAAPRRRATTPPPAVARRPAPAARFEQEVIPLDEDIFEMN